MTDALLLVLVLEVSVLLAVFAWEVRMARRHRPTQIEFLSDLLTVELERALRARIATKNGQRQKTEHKKATHG